jgi:hypothetical protein
MGCRDDEEETRATGMVAATCFCRKIGSTVEERERERERLRVFEGKLRNERDKGEPRVRYAYG